MPCRSNVSISSSGGAISTAARSTAALNEPLRRLPENPSAWTLAAAMEPPSDRNQDEHEPADGERQDRQRHADPRVLQKSDLHARLARGLGHDQVGDGAEQREIPRQ